jgi:hypothetical protein
MDPQWGTSGVGLLGVFAIAFLAVLAILWFFLPFAVFGIQPKIDKMLAEQKRTNELLTEINAALGKRDST